MGACHAYDSAPDGDLRGLGKQGQSSSPLQPAGIAEIEDERVDVVSDGELIDTCRRVEVTRVNSNRIVLRRLPHITIEGNIK